MAFPNPTPRKTLTFSWHRTITFVVFYGGLYLLAGSVFGSNVALPLAAIALFTLVVTNDDVSSYLTKKLEDIAS